MFCETCRYKYVEYCRLDYVEPSVARSQTVTLVLTDGMPTLTLTKSTLMLFDKKCTVQCFCLFFVKRTRLGLHHSRMVRCCCCYCSRGKELIVIEIRVLLNVYNERRFLPISQ